AGARHSRQCRSCGGDVESWGRDVEPCPARGCDLEPSQAGLGNVALDRVPEPVAVWPDDPAPSQDSLAALRQHPELARRPLPEPGSPHRLGRAPPAALAVPDGNFERALGCRRYFGNLVVRMLGSSLRTRDPTAYRDENRGRRGEQRAEPPGPPPGLHPGEQRL